MVDSCYMVLQNEWATRSSVGQIWFLSLTDMATKLEEEYVLSQVIVAHGGSPTLVQS